MAEARVGLRNSLYVLLGVASSAAFLVLAFARLRFDQVETALSTANLIPFLPLAVASYVSGHLLCRWSDFR